MDQITVQTLINFECGIDTIALLANYENIKNVNISKTMAKKIIQNLKQIFIQNIYKICSQNNTIKKYKFYEQIFHNLYCWQSQ